MRRTTAVGITAAVAAVIIGGLAVWWLIPRADGPDAAASAFLDALETDDPAAAVALLAISPQDDLVGAFEGATGLISGARVAGIDTDGTDSARARVEFELDGRPHEATFGLMRTPDGWRVDADALGTLTASTTLGDSVVSGAAVLPAGSAVALLPAAYEVGASPSGILDGATSAVVLPGESTEADVEATLSAGADGSAQSDLDAYADACAQAAASVPAHCGLAVPWAADLATLDTIDFRIESYPQVAIAPDAGSFAATGGSIVATASGTTAAGAPGSFTYRTDDWTLRGTVTFSGDEMLLSVQ